MRVIRGLLLVMAVCLACVACTEGHHVSVQPTASPRGYIPPSSAPPSSMYTTVSVEVQSVGPQNLLTPNQIAALAGVASCRWWGLAMDNQGSVYDDVTHVLVPTSRVQAVVRSVKASSKLVVKVSRLADQDLNTPPGPSGTRTYYSGSC